MIASTKFHDLMYSNKGGNTLPTAVELLFEEYSGVHPKTRIGHSYNFCFGIDKASWLPARVSCSTHLQVPDSCNVFMNNWYEQKPGTPLFQFKK